MKKVLAVAAVLSTFALCAEAQDLLYRIDLKPSGMMLTAQAPVWKGTTLIFKRFPDNTLMSVRKSDVGKISQIPRDGALQTSADNVVRIGNLAMQGGSTQAGQAKASPAPARKSANEKPELGEGFYSNLVVGQSIADPNSANDYQVGRTFAEPPPNAVQSSAGAPPTMPSATDGSNPPQ